MIKRIGRKIFLAVLVLAFGSIIYIENIAAVASGCNGCERTAILYEFANLDSPEWEQEKQAWDDCMRENLPDDFETFDSDNPLLIDALEKCESVEPDWGADRVNPLSLQSRLAELLNSPCFGIIPSVGGESAENVEYLFLGGFETDLEGEVNAKGKEITSRMTLELYFNGSSQELVKSWTTESTINTTSSHYNRMFENRDAEMRKDMPIEEIIWDFEKKPVQCSIETEKDEAKLEEKIKVTISGFWDDWGNPSREFNRIVVQAVEGEIIGGVPLAAGEELKAFMVGDGKVEFTYKAPKDCKENKDKIYINNSCDILPESVHPLSLTELGEEIASVEIDIKCHKFEIEYENRSGDNFWFQQQTFANGRIPVDVKIDQDGYYRLEGEGSFDIEMTAGLSAELWVFWMDKPGIGTGTVFIEGDMVDVGGDVNELYITWTENWGTTWNNPTAYMVSIVGSFTTPVYESRTFTSELVFPMIDGYTVSEQYILPYGIGYLNKTWTLHVNEE